MIREISTYNFDEWLFDYFEGTLSASEIKIFNDFLTQNPSLKQELLLWEKTYVATDNVTVPEDLEEEYRRPIVFWTTSKIILLGFLLTASIVLALWFFGTQQKEHKIFPRNLNFSSVILQDTIVSAPEKQEIPSLKKQSLPFFARKKEPVEAPPALVFKSCLSEIPDSLLMHKPLNKSCVFDDLPVIYEADSLSSRLPQKISVFGPNYDPPVYDDLQGKLDRIENSLAFKIAVFLLENIMNGNFSSSSSSSTSSDNNGGNSDSGSAGSGAQSHGQKSGR